MSTREKKIQRVRKAEKGGVERVKKQRSVRVGE